MPLGPERITLDVMVGALSTTTEYNLWTNPFSDSTDVYEVETATFNQLAAITGTTTHNWGIYLHHVTTAGVHTTVIGTLAYQSGTDHTAYIADDLTLASTGRQVAPGEGLNVNCIDGGTQANLSADARVSVVLVKGSTSAA